jgi:hypothetical protein
MTTRKTTRLSPSWRSMGLALIAVLVVGLLAGCNLGANPEGVAPSATTPAVFNPQQVATNTPLIELPLTPTATTAPTAAETLGPITITGTEHRTAEPVTITVQRGKSVGTVTCSWVLQDTNRTGTLATPTITTLNENTFVDTYTFTPDAAGTYVVNCTGIATTAAGQRAVSSNGTPFAVEAKG